MASLVVAAVAAGGLYGCLVIVRTNPDYQLDDTDPTSPSDVLLADLDAATTVPVGADGLGATTETSGSGREALAGFAEAYLTVTSPSGEQCQVCVLAATTEQQRERGLMEVLDPDLGGYEAMVFVYRDPAEGSFWMRNTPLPLAISYVDGAGTVISQADMEPCADVSSCSSYPVSGPFRLAIEVPRDRAQPLEIEVGSTVVVEAFSCPEAPADG